MSCKIGRVSLGAIIIPRDLALLTVAVNTSGVLHLIPCSLEKKASIIHKYFHSESRWVCSSHHQQGRQSDEVHMANVSGNYSPSNSCTPHKKLNCCFIIHNLQQLLVNFTKSNEVVAAIYRRTKDHLDTKNIDLSSGPRIK